MKAEMIKRLCWVAAALCALPFLFMATPSSYREILNPRSTYPYFPYVIFDVLFNLTGLALLVALPFLALIVHYNRQCADAAAPSAETTIAIAVSLGFSFCATAGITFYWLLQPDGFDPFMGLLLPFFTVPIMASSCFLAWIAANITRNKHKTPNIGVQGRLASSPP